MMVKNEICKKMEALNLWRTDEEFKSLDMFRGERLQTQFQRISHVYHEKLHRLKLNFIRKEV